MRSALVSASALLLATATLSNARALLAQRDSSDSDYTDVCKQIESSISGASQVYWPGSVNYLPDLSHWENSSSQLSACVVEPGCDNDISTIVKIVGSTNTPFAIKGGGHNNNPGFSSTLGVHIAMTRYKDVVYSAGDSSAVVGAGCIWDDVYGVLDNYNVTVIGARMPQVGVSGVTLGGGYSWLTNQRGLIVDNILAYDIVLPTGEIKTVTNDSDPELFFGLRGGGNNYGIVTRFTFKTFYQGLVWGGFMLFGPEHRDDYIKALANFTTNVTDPKAAVIASFLSTPAQALNIFYDGEAPPPGVYDDFLAIPTIAKDLSTRPMLSLVQAAQVVQPAAPRGYFNTVSLLKNTPNMINVIANETEAWTPIAASYSTGSLLSYAVEPFQNYTLQYGSDSAWPPSRDQGILPFSMYVAWNESKADDDFYYLATTSGANIHNAALAEGQDIANTPFYPNYLIYGTPLEKIFGSNLPRLRALKQKVDPQNVMGLAGGWKF